MYFFFRRVFGMHSDAVKRLQRCYIDYFHAMKPYTHLIFENKTFENWLMNIIYILWNYLVLSFFYPSSYNSLRILISFFFSHLSLHVSIWLTANLFVCSSVCLPVCLSIWLFSLFLSYLFLWSWHFFVKSKSNTLMVQVNLCFHKKCLNIFWS